MSSEFEKLVQQNKDEFDSEIPAGKVWERIEDNITVKRKVFTLKEVYKWSAAAAVFCILLTSVYFLFLRKPDNAVPLAKEQYNEKSLPGNNDEILKFAPEHADEVRQISQAIEVSQQELQRKAKDEPQLYREFAADLKMLDSSYYALKSQAVLSSNRDIIIKAMLANLRLQAELLTRQLMIMNNSKETKTFQNEKSSNQPL